MTATLDTDPDVADAAELYQSFLQRRAPLPEIIPIPLTPKQVVDADSDLIERWRGEAQKISQGKYKLGSSRGVHFEDGYVAARLHAQGMSGPEASNHADRHLAVSRKLTPNQARAKREGVAAGYRMHGIGARTPLAGVQVPQ
jgi:hypothetical protein